MSANLKRPLLIGLDSDTREGGRERSEGKRGREGGRVDGRSGGV